MEISVNDLLMIIGRQTAEIEKRTAQVLVLAEEVKVLRKKDAEKKPKKTPKKQKP